MRRFGVMDHSMIAPSQLCLPLPHACRFNVTDHFMAKYLASLNAVLGRGGVLAAAATAADVLGHGGTVGEAVAAAAVAAASAAGAEAEGASPAAGAALEDSAHAASASAAASAAAAVATAAAAATSAPDSCGAAGTGQGERQHKQQAEEQEAASGGVGGSAEGVPAAADEGQSLPQGLDAPVGEAPPAEGKVLGSQQNDCTVQDVQGMLAEAPFVRLLCSAGG